MYSYSKTLEFIFISHGALILHQIVEGGNEGGDDSQRGGPAYAAHATRVRDTIGVPSAWRGGPRERGPHTCKRMLLKGRAEPKNRSLKCNDIVVFNARLFKTVPFVFLEPASYFWRYQPPLDPFARPKPL